MRLEEYIEDSQTLVNKRINGYINKKESACKLIKDAMLYSINCGGKRIRPTLMFLTYEFLSTGKKTDIVDAAAAIEMVHTYSLIHDDLPAMDNDDLRRGKPTNHKVFGDGVAVLAGDGLLTDAFHIISSSKKINEEKKGRVIEILSRRAGSSGMVSGQTIDLISEGTLLKKNSKKELAEQLDYIHQHKTADMIMAACEMGCILADKEKDLKSISNFAQKIGFAFQIADDILDVIGDKKKMGKNGSDKKNNKLTYVSFYGIEKSKELEEKLLSESLKILDMLDGRDEHKKLMKEMAYLLIGRDR
jgi:geranylgeranyl diphosphate synthase type II